MASSEINAMYDRFSSYIKDLGDRTVLNDRDDIEGTSTQPVKSKKVIDFIGNIGRTKEAKGKNDAVRTLFSDTIKGMFGVSDMEALPDSVKAAMKLNDYGKGKPLTARRIRAVQTAVDQYLASVAQEVGVPADDAFKDLFRQVQLACHDDKVALSIVTANIKPILIDSSRNLCSPAAIQAKVAAIVASCDELRQVANGNQAVLVAGKMCLIAQNGKALQPGAFRDMMQTVGTMDTRALERLSASSSQLEIHQAVREVATAIDNIMNTAPWAVRMDADMRSNCREFLTGALVARCSDASVRKMQAAFTSKAACDLMEMYAQFDDESTIQTQLTENLSQARRDKLSALARADIIEMNRLATAVSRHLRKPDVTSSTIVREDSIQRSFATINPHGRETLDVKNDLSERARKALLAERQLYLDDAVRGKTPGGDKLRGVFDRALGPESSGPVQAMNYRFMRTLKNGIGQQAVADSNRFVHDLFDETGFVRDRRGISISLPDGTTISDDKDEARDQIAAYITKGAKTSYSALDQSEKDKAHLIMSFLTRGVADAAFRNMRIALDPAQRNPAFEIANDPPSADTWEVRLGYNGEEDPVLSFTSHKSVSRLQTREADGSLVTTDVGPGSTIDVKFDLNIRSHVSFARDQKPITDIHFTASIN